MPFQQRFDSTSMFDMLDRQDGAAGPGLVVTQAYQQQMMATFDAVHKIKSDNRLLYIPFVSVSDYIFLLRGCCQTLQEVKQRAIIYLAAAVSDYYTPYATMAVHKIQSRDGPLKLSLQQVPKMIKPLMQEWCPDAFVISFKVGNRVCPCWIPRSCVPCSYRAVVWRCVPF